MGEVEAKGTVDLELEKTGGDDCVFEVDGLGV